LPAGHDHGGLSLRFRFAYEALSDLSVAALVPDPGTGTDY
jgi:hypothetical protein